MYLLLQSAFDLIQASNYCSIVKFDFMYSQIHAVSGLCGLVTFAMCVIGVEMTMEAMVTLLWYLLATSIYYFIELDRFSCYCTVVLFQSREHENCGPQPGYVRAHIESKFFCFLIISEYSKGRLVFGICYLFN